MQEVAGQRKGTKKYFYDGYFYHSDPRYAHFGNAFICTYRYRQWECLVTARTNLDGKVTVKEEHHHSRISLEEYLRFEEFKAELKEQARATTAAPDIILEAARKKYADVAHHIQEKSARMHILRERKKSQPRLPESLCDLGNVLLNYAPAQGIYRGQVVVSKDSSAIIFTSHNMLQRLNSCSEIYVDGTFKCVPKGISAKQLLILHMRKMNVGIASVFVLCSCQTAELYIAIWNFLLERAPGMKTSLQYVMMDFERALIKSVRESMPWVAIRGCWFHFTRAISGRWQNLGLKDTASPIVQDILSLAWVLPLLPAKYFTIAIEFYRKRAEEVEPEHRSNVDKFIDYLEKEWLRIAEIVSLWGSPNRTNNVCESFHGKLSRRLGVRSNFYVFIEKLVNVVGDIERKWQELERDGNSLETKRHKQAAIDTYISYQQALLFNRKIDVSEFLMKLKTKNVKDFIQFKLYAPQNIKNYNSEDMMTPEELLNYLDFPRTMEQADEEKDKEKDEAPAVVQKRKLSIDNESVVMQESEVQLTLIITPEPMIEPNTMLTNEETVIMIEPIEVKTDTAVKVCKSEPEHLITPTKLCLEQNSVTKRRKPNCSACDCKSDSPIAKYRKSYHQSTVKSKKNHYAIKPSPKLIQKKVKKSVKPLDQPAVEPEPRYKLASFFKKALETAEINKPTRGRPKIGDEPRYKLSSAFKKFLSEREP